MKTVQDENSKRGHVVASFEYETAPGWYSVKVHWNNGCNRPNDYVYFEVSESEINQFMNGQAVEYSDGSFYPIEVERSHCKEPDFSSTDIDYKVMMRMIS